MGDTAGSWFQDGQFVSRKVGGGGVQYNHSEGAYLRIRETIEAHHFPFFEALNRLRSSVCVHNLQKRFLREVQPE